MLTLDSLFIIDSEVMKIGLAEPEDYMIMSCRHCHYSNGACPDFPGCVKILKLLDTDYENGEAVYYIKVEEPTLAQIKDAEENTKRLRMRHRLLEV